MKKSEKLKTTFDEYTIQEQLGQGGAGTVYKATNEYGKDFAIKVLKNTSTEKKKRFKNEFIFCRKNAHSNIIFYCDHGNTNNGFPFIVMPLYESSLRSIIRNVEPEQAYHIYLSIINGIEFAHSKKIVHRDIKPENILINSDDFIPVIADFGIAQFCEEDLYTVVDTKPVQRLANFQYAAPEQRQKDAIVDHRADIFALGLLLNELFTGKVPHGTDYTTIGSVAPKYAYLDPIVRKMISHDPQNRYSSINDIKNAIYEKGKYDWVKIKPFDMLTSATHFSEERLALSFPGFSGIKWFNDRETIIERLEIFFKPPLEFHGFHDPIWWFRGRSSLHIRKFRHINNGIILLNDRELCIKKIAVVRNSYYNSYIYLETKPMLPIDKKPEEIQELLGHSSYVSEGYGLYKENIITYSESEDGAAEINGKLLELDGSQEIRTRYLTPYNFLIAPKGSSINLSHEDINIRCILDGILNGTKSFNELNEFILDLPKPFF